MQVLAARHQLRVVGGDPYPEKDIDGVVQRILHSDISEFFLFDGETLARFEEMLRSDDSASVFVRDNLEKALGIPALRLLSGDVDALAEEAGADVRRAARAAKVSKDHEKALAMAEQELLRADKDLSDLEGLQRAAQVALDDANEALKEVDSIKEAYYQRKSLREQLDERKADEQATEESIRQILDAAWWLPLAERLQREAQEAANALAELSAARATVIGLERDLLRINEQRRTPLVGRVASRCRQISRKGLYSRKSELEQQLTERRQGPTVDALALRQRRLRRFNAAAATVTSAPGVRE